MLNMGKGTTGAIKLPTLRMELALGSTSASWENSSKILISNQGMVRFWKDKWLNNSALIDDYPNIFHIALDKNSSIA